MEAWQCRFCCRFFALGSLAWCIVFGFWVISKKIEIKRETSRFEKQRQAKTCCSILSGLQHKWLDLQNSNYSGIFRAIAISFMDFSLCFFPCFFLQNRKLEVGGRQYMWFEGKKNTPWGSKSTISLVVCTKPIEKYARENRFMYSQKKWEVKMSKRYEQNPITWPGKKNIVICNEWNKKTPNQQLQVGHDEITTGASSMSQKRESLGQNPFLGGWGNGKTASVVHLYEPKSCFSPAIQLVWKLINWYTYYIDYGKTYKSYVYI